MFVEKIKNGGTATVLDISGKLPGTGLKGVIAVDYGNTAVTLQGSLDNSTWFVIETFSADTMKEITLVPYLAVNGAADTSQNDSIGSSVVKLFFDQRAFQ